MFWINKILLFGLLLFTLKANCDELAYHGYSKLTIGYVLDMPDKVRITGPLKNEVSLYEGVNFNYSLETGIAVFNGVNELHLGVSYIDVLGQTSDSRRTHNPYMFEAFTDYQYNYSSHWFSVIGVGYKILQDDRIESRKETDTNLKEYYDINIHHMIDNVTARLSIGYHFNDHIDFSLNHHSQWLKGKPFSSEWEYHITTLAVSYNF